MMLVDRQPEREVIEAALASARSELVVVYGRRGVGKTTLLTETLARRPHLYYQATTRVIPQQLEDLTAALRAYQPEAVLPGTLPAVDSFLDALLALARRQPGQPVVVVLDELPYLAQADPSIPTVLQRWWDLVKRGWPTRRSGCGSPTCVRMPCMRLSSAPLPRATPGPVP